MLAHVLDRLLDAHPAHQDGGQPLAHALVVAGLVAPVVIDERLGGAQAPGGLIDDALRQLLDQPALHPRGGHLVAEPQRLGQELQILRSQRDDARVPQLGLVVDGKAAAGLLPEVAVAVGAARVQRRLERVEEDVARLERRDQGVERLAH